MANLQECLTGKFLKHLLKVVIAKFFESLRVPLTLVIAVESILSVDELVVNLALFILFLILRIDSILSNWNGCLLHRLHQVSLRCIFIVVIVQDDVDFMEVLHKEVKLFGENEKFPVSGEAMLLLPVVQEVTEVNVKELSSVFLDQVISWMSIPDT